MRTALLSLALLFPTVASAGVGFGTTMGMGSSRITIDFNGNITPAMTAGGFLPTLDLHFDKFVLQVHLLETLDLLFNEDIFLGANGYIEILDSPVGGSWSAVVAPGAGIDILGDPFVISATGEARFGVRSNGPAGVGVFVVPAVGVAVGDVDSDLVAAGTVQFSMWFGGSGGSSSSRPSTTDTL
ncbi:MAG: hypothetical protein KC912_06760 [Proteobacteria bacterium]|nr:hypothetical protein [Pseudomonadota bacterium]